MASTNVTIVPRRKRREEVVPDTGFCPSDDQRRFLQLALASGGPLNIGRLCQQLGISRTTYYRCRDQPGFSAWMSAHWVSALLADGGRLLSIGRAHAGSDFRYWRAMVELVFDPRGLGLLTAWQQRIADAGAAVAPLFDDDDPGLEADLDDLEPAWNPNPLSADETAPKQECREDSREEYREDQPEPEAASEPDPDPESAPEQGHLFNPVVTPSDCVESTTCKQKMEHSATPRRARRPTPTPPQQPPTNAIFPPPNSPAETPKAKPNSRLPYPAGQHRNKTSAWGRCVAQAFQPVHCRPEQPVT